MFIDYTCFASDLLYFAVVKGRVAELLDCTASGNVQYPIQFFCEILKNSEYALTRDLLFKVTEETGCWDDGNEVDYETLCERAIYCSLPDSISEEFIAELMECVFYVHRRKQNTQQWRESVYKFAKVIDNL